ncbi:MAG: DUF202 domain-containing protein [Propionicimonas sp.]|nr:DUF202 domain-containing protein [Propionicimonas sp.]
MPGFTKRFLQGGTEPDPRFVLANERTFLAWVSVSLGLVSVGVGLESLALALDPALRKTASVVLVVAGIASAAYSWLSWLGNERALRREQPLPKSEFTVVLAVAVLVAAILVLVALVAA